MTLPIPRQLVVLVLAALLTVSVAPQASAAGQSRTADHPGAVRGVALQGERPPGTRGEGGPEAPPAEALHPLDNPEAARKAYLTLLFGEVNVRRDRAASPPFETMLDTGNEAVNAYLSELTPAMEQRHACFHGSEVVGLRAGWDYLPEYGVQNQVGGEVLACPDVDNGGFWTPPGIADGWWRSPHHFDTLYADDRPNAVACGAYNQIRERNAYETVACITLLPVGAP